MDVRPTSGTLPEFKDTTTNGQFSFGSNKSNALFNFLGPTYNQVVPRAFDNVNYEIYDLEEALKNQKETFSTIITGLITTYNNNFLTKEVLPWRYSQSLQFTWNEWHFNTPPASRVPNRAPPRLISSKKSVQGVGMVRRGIAFEMENDYLTTVEGQENLKYNILSIAQVVQETQNYDVLRALLTCKTYAELWTDWIGAKSPFSFIELMTFEVANFGCLCFDEYSFDNTFNRVKAWMMAKGFQPDTIIIPSGMKQFLSMGDNSSEFVKQSVSGGVGLNRHLEGERAFNTYQGCTVYETKAFHGGEGLDTLQNLYARQTIGERYMMGLSQTCYSNAKTYESCMRSIFIDNLNTNSFDKITFEQAFMETGVFSKDTGGYSKHVKKLWDEYKKNPGNYTDEAIDQHYSDNEKGTQPAFMFMCKDSKGEWTMPTHFGKMGYHAIGFKDFNFMAETVLAKIDDCIEDCSPAKQWEDMMTLIRNIENQSYNEEFFIELIRVNIGELEATPDGVMSVHDATTKIMEWKPNQYGTLELPNERVKIKYPIGYANGPGLRYLSTLTANEKWKHVAVQAEKAIRLLNSIVAILRRVFPTSELINEANRSPWFHKADPLTTFFSHTITVDRDPIFLPQLTIPPVQLPAQPGQKQQPQGQIIGQGTDEHDLTAMELLAIIQAIANNGDLTNVVNGLECSRIPASLILIANVGNVAGILFATHYDYAMTNNNTILENGLKAFAEYFCAEINNSHQQFASIIWNSATRVIHTLDKLSNALFQQELVAFQQSTDKATYIKKNQMDIEDVVNVNRRTALLGLLLKSVSNANNGRVCWLRTPLTMSPQLLDSIIDEENKSNTQHSLALPGDYTTMHISPIPMATMTHLPDHYKKRPAYDDLTLFRVNFFKEERHIALVHPNMVPVGNIRKRKSTSLSMKKAKKRKTHLFFAAPEDESSSEDHMEDMYMQQLKKFEETQGKKQPLQSLRGDDFPGEIYTPTPGEKYSKQFADFNTETLKKRWIEGYQIPNPVSRAIYWVILFSQCDHLEHWLTLDKNDVYAPVNIMLSRPNIEFLMATAIIMKKGLSTGASVYTVPDFQVGRDVVTKKVLGNYTFWATAIVQNPIQVALHEALRPIRYLGGCNTVFMRNKDDLFHTKGINRPSLLAFIMPVTETKHPRFMSLTGFYPVNLYNPDVDGPNVLQWSSAPFYESIYTFSGLIYNKSVLTYETKLIRPNTIIIQGTQFNWNSVDKAYSTRIIDQGHRKGKGANPHSINVWNGNYKMFSDYNWKGKELS